MGGGPAAGGAGDILVQLPYTALPHVRCFALKGLRTTSEARFTTPTGWARSTCQLVGPDSPHQLVEPDSPHQLVGPDSPHRLVRPDLPHQLVSTRIGQCSSAVLIASAHKANAKPERVRGFCASAHFFPKSSESKKLARLVFSTRFDQRIRRIPSSRLSTRTPV